MLEETLLAEFLSKRTKAELGKLKGVMMELNPTAAGFSAKKLERIEQHLNENYLDAGKITGCQGHGIAARYPRIF